MVGSLELKILTEAIGYRFNPMAFKAIHSLYSGPAIVQSQQQSFLCHLHLESASQGVLSSSSYKELKLGNLPKVNSKW